MILPTPATVTKSAGRFTSALVIQRLIAFGYFAFAARYLGPSAFGSYVWAINLAMAVGALADLGLANVLTREAAKQPQKINSLWGMSMAVKVVLIGLAYVVLQLTGAISPVSGEVKILLWGTGLVMIVDAITLLAYAVVRAQHRLPLEGWGSIITQLVVAVLGVPLILTHPQATSMVLALLGGSIVNLWYSLTLVRHSGVKFHIKITAPDWRWLWGIMWPFAASLVLTRFYGYADGIVIGWIKGQTAVGYYGVAAKILTSLQFIPLAFVAALYPALAACYGRHDQRSLQTIFYQSLKYMWFLGLLLMALIGGLAAQFLPVIFSSAYNHSIVLLEILIIQLPLLFISFPLGSLLNACDRQRRTTMAVATALIFDILLLILLLPSWGLTGAAVASTVSTAVMVVIQLEGVRKMVWSSAWVMLAKFILNLAVTLVVSILLLVLRNVLPWALLGVMGAVIYIVFSYAVGIVQKSDFRQIMGILKSK